MGEAVFKTLIVLILGVVAFFAFKVGNWWGQTNQTSTITNEISADNARTQPDNAYSIVITNLEYESEGVRVFANIVLDSGRHNYQCRFWFYDEGGKPLKDTNGQYNINEYVGVRGDLGEIVVADNCTRECSIDFVIPYEELHTQFWGEKTFAITGRLIRDENIVVADSETFIFTLVHSK